MPLPAALVEFVQPATRMVATAAGQHYSSDYTGLVEWCWTVPVGQNKEMHGAHIMVH